MLYAQTIKNQNILVSFILLFLSKYFHSLSYFLYTSNQHSIIITIIDKTNEHKRSTRQGKRDDLISIQ